MTQFDSLTRHYKINPSGGVSGDLPVILLFEDGKEHARYPPLASGQYQKKNYKERDIVKYFDLEKRFMATKDIKK